MTVQTRPPFESLRGNRLGIGSYGELVSRRNGITSKRLTSRCVDASISVAAEAADVRAITVTLKDSKGNALDYAETVELVVYKDATPTDFCTTGGSTGIAIGASGKLLTIVAKKYFKAISTTAGVIALTWTDTGTESVSLGVILPNGTIVQTAAFANA